MADVVELLIAERDRLNEAIAALGGPRRRGRPRGRGPGRPPGSGKKAAKKVAAKKARKRPAMSEDQRKAVSLRMKKYWAKRKRAAKKAAKKSS